MIFNKKHLLLIKLKLEEGGVLVSKDMGRAGINNDTLDIVFSFEPPNHNKNFICG